MASVLKKILIWIVTKYIPDIFRREVISHYIAKPKPSELYSLLSSDSWKYFIDSCERKLMYGISLCKDDNEKLKLIEKYNGVRFVSAEAESFASSVAPKRDAVDQNIFGLDDETLLREARNGKRI